MGNVVNDENVIKGYILSLDNCCSQIYDLKIKNDLIVKIAYHVDNYVNSKKTMFTLDNVLTWFKNLTYSHKVWSFNDNTHVFHNNSIIRIQFRFSTIIFPLI